MVRLVGSGLSSFSNYCSYKVQSYSILPINSPAAMVPLGSLYDMLLGGIETIIIGQSPYDNSSAFRSVFLHAFEKLFLEESLSKFHPDGACWWPLYASGMMFLAQPRPVASNKPYGSALIARMYLCQALFQSLPQSPSDKDNDATWRHRWKVPYPTKANQEDCEKENSDNLTQFSTISIHWKTLATAFAALQNLRLILDDDDAFEKRDDGGPLCLTIFELAISSLQAVFQSWRKIFGENNFEKSKGAKVRRVEASINLFLTDLHALLVELDIKSKSRTLSNPDLLRFNYYVLCFKQWARLENTTPTTTEKQKTLDSFFAPSKLPTATENQPME